MDVKLTGANPLPVTIFPMSQPESPDDERVDQFIVYAAYGEVMHQFQVFEITLWGFLTRGIKPCMSADQAMEKVEKWDATTFGKVIRGLKSQPHWPDGMTDELVGAVQARNYVAHHFLREYFIVTPSAKAKEQATEQLARISTRIEHLEDQVVAHLGSLGVSSIGGLDEDAQAEIDKLRPTDWLGAS
jgi:hypothetical protein